MSISDKVLSSVKAKLDAITNQTKKQSLIWRPPRGTEISVRIIPYKHSSDPFNELYFHYDVGQIKTILCPQSAGVEEKCPICEYVQFLLAGEKSDSNYALYKRLKSRLRVYVPIIVRGQESEGVKFWGIGKNTYTTIAQFFVDPEYGDLSDPLKGRDLKILATNPSPQYIYGQVQIRPAANTTRLSEDVNLAKSFIANCPNVLDAFIKMTEEEIQQALESFNAQSDDTQIKDSNETVNINDEHSELDDMFKEISNQ